MAAYQYGMPQEKSKHADELEQMSAARTQRVQASNAVKKLTPQVEDNTLRFRDEIRPLITRSLNDLMAELVKNGEGADVTSDADTVVLSINFDRDKMREHSARWSRLIFQSDTNLGVIFIRYEIFDGSAGRLSQMKFAEITNENVTQAAMKFVHKADTAYP